MVYQEAGASGLSITLVAQSMDMKTEAFSPSEITLDVLEAIDAATSLNPMGTGDLLPVTSSRVEFKEDDDDDGDGGGGGGGEGGGGSGHVSSSGRRERMTVDEKKRRNRDCMRRLRQRRTSQVVDMKKEVAHLEAELHKQTLAHSMADRERALTAGKEEDKEDGLPVALLPHAPLNVEARQLREANYWLTKQIREKKAALVMVQDLVQNHDAHSFRAELRVLEAEQERRNGWIHNLHHFFALLREQDASEIVLQSHRVIQDCLHVVQAQAISELPILGWRDQRWLEGPWANFQLQKTFPHEDMRRLVHLTWQLSSHIAEINHLQPQLCHMKVLQRLSPHALVVARQSHFQMTGATFCTIYLLFLLETEDGFVIGTRSLEPERKAMEGFMSEGMIYGKLFYAFHFQQGASGDCHVMLGGRADNVTELGARHCLMDMMLAVLRWENYCIGPLCRLTTG